MLRQIDPDELQSWILQRTPELLVVNKPPWVVCHPSRHGPWSSLIGAFRELLGVERLHMPFRLDRETSGVLVFALDRETGCRLQHAVMRGDFRKSYLAILEGQMQDATLVDQPIGRDTQAEFYTRQTVTPGGQAARTEFVPVGHAAGYTMARVYPHSGRRHQIRVHAAWLGHPVAGDKLYSREPGLMLEFVRNECPEEQLLARLPLPRQALHCAEVVFVTPKGEERFEAPLSVDLQDFWRAQARDAAQ